MNDRKIQCRFFKKEIIRPDMEEHLVFLDESGINTNTTRLYGWVPSSQRTVDHTPLNTPQTTTVLSSIRFDREKAFTTYQGGTIRECFVQYLKETLLPTLWPGDIVVMDNLRSHHVKAVREILEAGGMGVLYLPPYMPDLNVAIKKVLVYWYSCNTFLQFSFFVGTSAHAALRIWADLCP